MARAATAWTITSEGVLQRGHGKFWAKSAGFSVSATTGEKYASLTSTKDSALLNPCSLPWTWTNLTNAASKSRSKSRTSGAPSTPWPVASSKFAATIES